MDRAEWPSVLPSVGQLNLDNLTKEVELLDNCMTFTPPAGSGRPEIRIRAWGMSRLMEDRAVSSSLIQPVQSHREACSGHRPREVRLVDSVDQLSILVHPSVAGS